MKKLKMMGCFLLLLFFFHKVNAQAPKAFYMQAFVSNENGQTIISQAVGVEIQIVQGGPGNSAIYTETHEAFTNSVGAIDLMIGLGNSSTENFNSIDWENGPYYMRLSIDKTGGTNYSLMGVSQFLSVPYAFCARNLIGPPGVFGLQGPAGPDGLPGPQGAPGQSCVVGTDPCWGFGPPGPQGPDGPQGSPGLMGLDTDGIRCWDLNANNQSDIGEDTNADGLFNIDDCTIQGPQGAQGITGPMGQKGQRGPTGPIGPTGPEGEQGDPGPTGTKGEPSFAFWENNENGLYRINGLVGIGNTDPACKLDVSGNICANGVLLTSDRRFKKNIEPLEKAFDKLLTIRGVGYDFKYKSFPNKDFSKNKQIGVIAQEVEVAYPELVQTNTEGYKSVSYDQLFPVLVNALQEVVEESEELDRVHEPKIAELKANIALLKSMLNTIEETATEEE